jgi:Ca2+-binding RTX toxin-like protein
MHTRRFILLISVFVLSFPLLMPSAWSGGSNCAYDAGDHEVTVSINDPFISSFGIRVDSGAIMVANEPCAPATVHNVDLITVVQNAKANLSVSLDITEPFAPGFTDEPGGSDEIEFEFELGTGEDHVTARGGDENNFLRAGIKPGPSRMKINLNANESNGVDGDVSSDTELATIALAGEGGNDVVSAAGGRGTGDPFPNRAILTGGENSDTVIGGPAGDHLRGASITCPTCPGADVIKGRGGKDEILGSLNGDLMVGGPGADSMEGGDGKDTMKGSAGGDELFGQGGADKLNGGPNSDKCRGGPGNDTIKNCEI